jgi:hypothetical protein
MAETSAAKFKNLRIAALRLDDEQWFVSQKNTRRMIAHFFVAAHDVILFVVSFRKESYSGAADSRKRK